MVNIERRYYSEENQIGFSYYFDCIIILSESIDNLIWKFGMVLIDLYLKLWEGFDYMNQTIEIWEKNKV